MPFANTSIEKIKQELTLQIRLGLRFLETIIKRRILNDFLHTKNEERVTEGNYSLEGEVSINTHLSGLKAHLWSQVGAAVILIIYTLLLWSVSQTGYIRLELAVLLVVIPLECTAIVCALLTLRRARPEYLGAWVMLGLFRIIIGFQLPRISWVYYGLEPPPVTAIPMPTLGIAEVLLGCFTLFSVFLTRHAYETLTLVQKPELG